MYGFEFSTFSPFFLSYHVVNLFRQKYKIFKDYFIYIFNKIYTLDYKLHIITTLICIRPCGLLVSFNLYGMNGLATLRATLFFCSYAQWYYQWVYQLMCDTRTVLEPHR